MLIFPKNLFGNDNTTNCYQKDIMPTNGFVQPFVGIISCEKQDLRFTDIFDTKVDLNPTMQNFCG